MAAAEEILAYGYDKRYLFFRSNDWSSKLISLIKFSGTILKVQFLLGLIDCWWATYHFF
jgi:hypothetical protein